MSRVEVREVQFVGPVNEINSLDDNVDVQVLLSDGRMFSFLVATPNNIYRCMQNESVEHFFSNPPALFVNVLDEPHVRAVISSLIVEDAEKWLTIYEVLQT